MSRYPGGYRRWGLKLVVSLSYLVLKVYCYELLPSLYLENEGVYGKELSYLLSGQVDI